MIRMSRRRGDDTQCHDGVESDENPENYKLSSDRIDAILDHFSLPFTNRSMWQRYLRGCLNQLNQITSNETHIFDYRSGNITVEQATQGAQLQELKDIQPETQYYPSDLNEKGLTLQSEFPAEVSVQRSQFEENTQEDQSIQPTQEQELASAKTLKNQDLHKRDLPKQEESATRSATVPRERAEWDGSHRVARASDLPQQTNRTQSVGTSMTAALDNKFRALFEELGGEMSSDRNGISKLEIKGERRNVSQSGANWMVTTTITKQDGSTSNRTAYKSYQTCQQFSKKLALTFPNVVSMGLPPCQDSRLNPASNETQNLQIFFQDCLGLELVRSSTCLLRFLGWTTRGLQAPVRGECPPEYSHHAEAVFWTDVQSGAEVYNIPLSSRPSSCLLFKQQLSLFPPSDLEQKYEEAKKEIAFLRKTFLAMMSSSQSYAQAASRLFTGKPENTLSCAILPSASCIDIYCNLCMIHHTCEALAKAIVRVERLNRETDHTTALKQFAQAAQTDLQRRILSFSTKLKEIRDKIKATSSMLILFPTTSNVNEEHVAEHEMTRS